MPESLLASWSGDRSASACTAAAPWDDKPLVEKVLRTPAASFTPLVKPALAVRDAWRALSRGELRELDCNTDPAPFGVALKLKLAALMPA